MRTIFQTEFFICIKDVIKFFVYFRDVPLAHGLRDEDGSGDSMLGSLSDLSIIIVLLLSYPYSYSYPSP